MVDSIPIEETVDVKVFIEYCMGKCDAPCRTCSTYTPHLFNNCGDARQSGICPCQECYESLIRLEIGL